MEPHTIFAKGEFLDSPEGCNIAGTGMITRWVAVRGGIYDWCIYCQNPHYINSVDPGVIAVGYAGVWDFEKIAEEGDKIHSEENIRKLVLCSDKAFNMYRH